MTTAAFRRTSDQRSAALAEATRIRSAHAKLKQQVKDGEISAFALLHHPDCQTMPVRDLLLAVPKLGKVKVDRAMARARVSSRKRLKGLTARQQAELLVELPQALEARRGRDAAT